MKKTMTRLLSTALALSLSLCLLVPARAAGGFSRSKAYTPGQFTDVKDTDWFSGSVKDAFELGLMNGSTADAFNPQGTFTLAEAATIAARMHNIYNGGDGVIPPALWGPWYQGAVDYCVAQGIFGAYDFPVYTRQATRAQMAAIMAAALPQSAWAAINDIRHLPDVGYDTPGQEAILLLCNAGVVTGADAYGSFKPYASITRAEVAAIAARCADPALRKAFTPAKTQPNAMPSGSFGGEESMSCGRMLYKDSATGLYGFVDQYGNVAIPAQYKGAGKKFMDGYAQASVDGKNWGAIDVNGNVVLPMTYPALTNRGNGYFQTGASNASGCGMVHVKEGLVIPENREYSMILDMGPYILAAREYGVRTVEIEQGASLPADIYSPAGILAASYDRVSGFLGDPLLGVMQDGKYALAHWMNGPITPAVYDDVIPAGKTPGLAVGKSGSRECLMNAGGVIEGFELGKYTYTMSSNLVLAQDDIGAAVLLGADGKRLDVDWHLKELVRGTFYKKYFAAEERNGVTYLYETTNDRMALPRDPEYYLMDKAGRLLASKDDACGGKITAKNDTIRYTDAQGQAWAVSRTQGPVHEDQFVWIGTENGKPVVYQGAGDEKAPLIRFFTDGICYDSIVYAGEGCYCCTFGSTAYMVHP